MISIDDFLESCSFYQLLTTKQKILVKQSLIKKELKNTQTYMQCGFDCTGLILLQTGHIRAYIMSPNGKEITLYRLRDQEVCIMSASCVLNEITFDINLDAEKNSVLYIIPMHVIEKINKENIAFKEFVLKVISKRFSEVMFVLSQLVFSSMGHRLAHYLLQQSSLEKSPVLYVTHDKIARDLGSAREVVSRLLKKFQSDGVVVVTRQSITIINEKELKSLI